MIALDRWAVDRALLLQRELEEHYGEYRFWNVYSKVHNFCVQELGGFYLDIIKDRQYTTGANSTARRSCQTALYHISEALVRWIAPILAFTADELWQYLPGERNESVMLNTWYQGLSELPEGVELDRAYWERVMAVKVAVNKELENLRAAKALGGNLQAEVTLYAEEALAADLAKLGDELRFVLITSKAAVAPLVQAPADAVTTELGGLKLKVVKSGFSKCARCWHFIETVGSDPAHPDICDRCVTNISGPGEVRHYA
jgi:isoleucyl-tRNA synthetase